MGYEKAQSMATGILVVALQYDHDQSVETADSLSKIRSSQVVVDTETLCLAALDACGAVSGLGDWVWWLRDSRSLLFRRPVGRCSVKPLI